MTKIAVFQENASAEQTAFRAVTAGNQAMAGTAGEALDALTTQLLDGGADALIIVRSLCPDPFFTASQRQRLQELMARRRLTRDAGGSLAPEEQSKFEGLIEAEIHAATKACCLAGPRDDAINPLYPLVARRAGHRCEYCRARNGVICGEVPGGGEGDVVTTIVHKRRCVGAGLTHTTLLD
jgi:hypothetical protein